MDYSDDWLVKDDIPNSREEIKPGFDHANAFFIGNDALNDLNISEAEMCVLSSSQNCVTNCHPFADDAYLAYADACALIQGLNTNTKKLIAALSGQCNQPFMKNPLGVARLNGGDEWNRANPNARWCTGFNNPSDDPKRRSGTISGSDSESGYWYLFDYGPSLKCGWNCWGSMARDGGKEFGWAHPGRGWNSLKLDTFQIRIKTQ